MKIRITQEFAFYFYNNKSSLEHAEDFLAHDKFTRKQISTFNELGTCIYEGLVEHSPTNLLEEDEYDYENVIIRSVKTSLYPDLEFEEVVLEDTGQFAHIVPVEKAVFNKPIEKIEDLIVYKGLEADFYAIKGASYLKEANHKWKVVDDCNVLTRCIRNSDCNVSIFIYDGWYGDMDIVHVHISDFIISIKSKDFFTKEPSQKFKDCLEYLNTTRTEIVANYRALFIHKFYEEFEKASNKFCFHLTEPTLVKQ